MRKRKRVSLCFIAGVNAADGALPAGGRGGAPIELVEALAW